MKATDKKENKKISIRAKIFLAFLCIIGIAIALLWLCQVVLFDVVYNNVRIGEIETTARYVLRHTDKADFYSQLDFAVAKNNLCAVILSPDGEVTLSCENSNACLLHSLTLSERRELIEIAKDKDKVTFGLSYDPVSDEYDASALAASRFTTADNVFYVSHFTHNGKDFYLMLDGVISPVGTVTKTLASFLILLSLLLLLIAVILAHSLSKKIAHPITKISKQAKGLSAGNYTEVTSSTREISELNSTLTKASLDLKQVEHVRHELIANISHDLRTPLTLMGGYLEMMRDFPEEITEENLQTVIDETNRLSSLVSDILDISRIENGVTTPEPIVFSLTDSITETVGRYREFTRRDGYVISWEAAESVNIFADRTQIMQVITNLLNNAITYTGDDKTVTVRQSVSNGKVKISVSDTGVGIPEEKLPLIWERYYQIDQTHKRAAKGSGLGLSIVRTIISEHGGSYGAESTPGKGSTFWFELDCRI